MKVFILLICFAMGAVSAVSGDCIKGNCANGEGHYAYRDGSMYAGEWRNSMRDGQGIYNSHSGFIYEGQWKDDQFNGQGTYTYRDGSMYEGEWENNKRRGQGTYTGSNRAKYVGQWKNDRLTGQGFLITADGRRFIGQFDKDGKLIGKYISLFGKHLAILNLKAKPGVRISLAELLTDKLRSEIRRLGNSAEMQDLKQPAGCDLPECLVAFGRSIGIKQIITGSIFQADHNYLVDLKLINSQGPNVGVEKKYRRKCGAGTDELSDTTKALAALIMGSKMATPASEDPKLVKADKLDIVVKPKESEKRITPENKTSQPEKARKPKRTKEPKKISQPKKTEKTEPLADSNMFVGPNNMKFIYISPGSFVMGSLEDEPGKYNNETQHKVTLTKGFYMQITEVTQLQWMTVMGKNPSYYQYCGDKCPVEQVSWNDVQQFIWRLNQLEGAEKYRLPTEAEWEYACRAGSTASSHAGKITRLEGIDTSLATVAWFRGNSGKKVHPVARKEPNAWGLYDMHGNVSELCEDWYGEYASDQINPSGPGAGIDRIVRGGGWNVSARHCRSACRGAIAPGDSGYGIGFRLVRMP